jgi:predicted nucleic acid-binding protein
MSGYVCIDASLAAKWVLDEPDSRQALDFYLAQRSIEATFLSPAFMPIEVTNAIHRRVVRGMLTPDEGDRLMALFLEFSVELASPDGLHQAAMALARVFSLPAVYDMHYVALAQIVGCELWTADRRLLNRVAGNLPFLRQFPLG